MGRGLIAAWQRGYLGSVGRTGRDRTMDEMIGWAMRWGAEKPEV